MKTGDFLKQNVRWLSAGALLMFLSSFGQTFFISLFSNPIRREFSLSHGEWSTIYAIGTAASAAVMLWAGGLVDRFKTQHLGSLVLMGLAGACVFMAWNTSAGLLIVSVFLLRFFGQGMASHSAVVAMSRWFVATRGRALAVSTFGFTIGEALFPILIVATMTLLDWRLLWIGACLVALSGLPYLWWSLKTERSPQQLAEESQSVGMEDRHWSRLNALRHPLFWLMIPALLGPSAFNTVFFFHHAHFAEIKGMTQLALVSLFPIYTVVSVFAVAVSGWLVDRLGSARSIPLYQLPLVLGFMCFALADGWLLIAAGLVCLALTSGANSTLPNVFWAEFYGTRNIGAIKAMGAGIMVLGSALGPLVTGYFIDFGMGLDRQYFWVAGFFVITTLSMFAGILRYRDAAPAYRDRLR